MKQAFLILLLLYSVCGQSQTNKGVLIHGINNGLWIKTGNLGIGTTTPTARLHLPSGTATASTAPLKFSSGTNLTTPEDGAIEYNGTHYYATVGSTRYQLDQQSGALSGSGTSGRVAYWNGSSSLTSNSNFLFNGSVFSVGTTNTQGQLNVGGDKNLSSSGAQSYFASATYTDNTTAASGTSSAFAINYIAPPTIAATNTSVIFPSIVTLDIDKPIAGTHATIQKKYSLHAYGSISTDEQLLIAGGLSRTVALVASGGTLDEMSGIVLANATGAPGGNYTVNLPSAASFPGIEYTIKRTDGTGNTCTVIGTIDGATNYSLTAQYKYVTVTNDGTNWYIIGNN